MIKYQYALDKENEIVNIDTIIVKTSDVFICIACGNILIPKIGKIRKKHFSHKIQYNCSPETYLHKLGKRIFINEYSKCLKEGIPFVIELPEIRICNRFEDKFGITCKISPKTKEFNLTKYFKNIIEEQFDNNFKPDIQLTGQNNEKIYIEIAVTHKVTDEKINSGVRIIELLITQEEDLDFIKSRKILPSNNKIKLYNFKDLISKGSHCQKSKCESSFQTFILYKTGKSNLRDVSLSELQHLVVNEKIDFHKFTEKTSYNNELFKSEVIKAFNDGYKITNCFLCRYHAQNKGYYNEGSIFCKFRKITGNSNIASECSYYKPDTKCFPEVNLIKY